MKKSDEKPNPSGQRSPSKGERFLESAVKCHKSGNLAEAESLYNKAIESGLKNEKALAYSNLGVIYKKTHRKEEAICMYKRAI